MRYLVLFFVSVSFSVWANEERALKKELGKFAPVVLTADTSRLSQGDQQALAKILEAAKILKPLYLDQIWAGNKELLLQLQKDASPLGKLRLAFFELHAGPWSRLDHDRAVLPGAPKKPLAGTFYPADMTKKEYENWLPTLSEKEREKAKGFFTVIRRSPTGKLRFLDYSTEYSVYLQPVSQLFRDAAALASNPTLKRFLETRALAFQSDDYYASDVAWMELDAPLDITFGPYETYEDGLFNYKAAFESFIALRNDLETQKLAHFGKYLQELESNLPLDPAFRNSKLGALAPIRVVDQIFASGDARRGIMTAAFNLPNDERIVKERGAKRVMIKNVQEAKFEKVLVPIAQKVLSQEDQKKVKFDAFFTHILMHELMHGLGPHSIVRKGIQTTARQELKDLHSAIEEAKADITGLWAMGYLLEKEQLDPALKETLATTFLASAFRSVRFGVHEAHGKGVALQFNYLCDEGGIVHDKAHGTFRVNAEKFRKGVEKLSRELLTLEAKGDYSGAQKLLKKYAIIRSPMKAALARLETVPVDIVPTYPLAGE